MYLGNFERSRRRYDQLPRHSSSHPSPVSSEAGSRHSRRALALRNLCCARFWTASNRLRFLAPHLHRLRTMPALGSSSFLGVPPTRLTRRKRAVAQRPSAPQAHHFWRRHGAARRAEQQQQQQQAPLSPRKRLLASVRSFTASRGMPPVLPPSVMLLRERAPAYAAYVGVAALIALAVARALRSALRTLLQLLNPRPLRTRLRTAPPVVLFPQAQQTRALARITVRERTTAYAAKLWTFSSLLVIYAADLLGSVTAMRP